MKKIQNILKILTILLLIISKSYNREVQTTSIGHSNLTSQTSHTQNCYFPDSFSTTPQMVVSFDSLSFGTGAYEFNAEITNIGLNTATVQFTTSGAQFSGVTSAYFGVVDDNFREKSIQKVPPSNSQTINFDTPLTCSENPVGGILFHGQAFTATEREINMEVLEVTSTFIRVKTMPSSYTPNWVSFQVFASCSEKMEIFTTAQNSQFSSQITLARAINKPEYFKIGSYFRGGLSKVTQTNPNVKFKFDSLNWRRFYPLANQAYTTDPRVDLQITPKEGGNFENFSSTGFSYMWCDPTCYTCDLSHEVCQNCPPPRYLENNRCLPCDIIQNCSECTSSTDCTRCIPGYYMDWNTRTCHRCDLNCATCYQSGYCATDCGSTCVECDGNGDCTVCGPNKIINSGVCEDCPDGTYFNNGSCTPCDKTQCATCSSSPTTCVLQCNPDCKECLPTGLCETCEDQLFVDNLGACQNCDKSQCATCSGSSQNCTLQCNSDCKECDFTAQCTLCEDGKYLDNGSCLDCDQGCATCTTTGSCVTQCGSTCLNCDANGDCTSCGVGKVVNSGSCVSICNSGSYFDNGQCENCDNTVCATCLTSAQDCILPCNSDCKECYPMDGSCYTCHDQYYIDNGACLICDKTLCAKCSNSPQNCTKNCNPDCKECDSTGFCTLCNDGFYLTGSNTCEPCDNTQCATCNNTPTQCIIFCHNSCGTCDLQGNCLTCDQGYLNNNICDTSCNYQCGTCSTGPDSCTSCSDTNRDPDSDCECKEIGFFQINQDSICGVCESKCETCQNSSEDCQTCSENRQNPPECSCIDKYYQDPSDLVCKQCKYDCICQEYEICSQCLQTDSHLRSPINCQCKTGYFEDSNGQCQECDYKCKTCENSAENCTSCANLQFLSELIPDCNCLKGYYEDSNQKECKMCGPTCLSCNNQGVCNECILPSMRPPFCLNRLSNFYEVANNNDNLITDQLPCEFQCLTCENSAENCTECIVGRNRITEIPNCSCESGFHDQYKTQSDCEPCPSLCLTCIAQNHCQNCVENSILDQISLVCVCSPGFKEINDGISVSCKKCYQYKDECLLECPTGTQPNKQQFICSQIQTEISSKTLLFYVMASVTLLVTILLYLFFQKLLKLQPAKKIEFQFDKAEGISESNL